jgi:hypothetical protein
VPTSSSSARALPPALLVVAVTCVLLTGAVALAGPAAAIEDPRRPTAEVTHGPSCGPAVVRVAVTNGNEAHRVALVFDGAGAQDDAVLGGGEQAELVSEDVDWGQTVDVSVTVADADGTAEEPIRFGTYTRPTAEDCAAVNPTTSEPGPEPTAPAPPATSSGTAPAPAPPSSPAAEPTRPNDPGTPRPSSTAPSSPSTAPPATSTPDAGGGTPRGQAGSASAASVSPGGVVTVRATGFTPGEPVSIFLLGVDHPLTTVTAAADGSVEAVVQIPRGVALGAVTVRLVGGYSAATAGVDLQVAARSQPVPQQTASAPMVAAVLALMGTGGALGLMAARRSRGHHGTTRR